MVWRWAFASVIGTSHIQSGARLQDACAVQGLGNDGILAVVSDGAGSADFGAYGARITCWFLSRRFREWACTNAELPTDEVLADWIDQLRDRIDAIAARRGSSTRQFAATLAAIVVSENEAVTLQIGDSAVVARGGGKWSVLCWPDNGEYASTTYFVTDVPGPRLRIIRHSREHDAFALFSDGVGDVALSHLDHAAHPQFLDPMMRPIDNAMGAGFLGNLSGKLADYLAGPAVCERTDDDKTLILISGG